MTDGSARPRGRRSRPGTGRRGARPGAPRHRARGWRRRPGHRANARIGRSPRHHRGRAPGVALGGAAYVAATIGPPLAARLRPPQHRRAAAHDPQHRRMCRIAEALGRDGETMLSDETFAHCRIPLLPRPRQQSIPVMEPPARQRSRFTDDDGITARVAMLTPSPGAKTATKRRPFSVLSGCLRHHRPRPKRHRRRTRC